jgi:hypothetical protein
MVIDLEICRTVPLIQTPRVLQLSGMFDVPPVARSASNWKHHFELPEQWNVGVIVGPSGSGKTTLAREAFPGKICEHWNWPPDKSIMDGFPQVLGIRDIVGLLSSVGFSSPPSWLRPFHALSTGEQFRVNVARTLAESPDLAVIDEFTSVVDRTVAQIGSAAAAKTVRRRGQKLVAVSCHYDILDWMEPDWIYEPNIGKLTLNFGPDGSRGSLWRRPKIELEISRVHSSAWELFKSHHYLSGKLHPSATCFVAFYAGRPVAIDAWLPFVGALPEGRKARRLHRIVCLPDFQGVHIGFALEAHNASLWAGLGYRVFCRSSHPAEVQGKLHSALWKITSLPGFTALDSSISMGEFKSTRTICRLATSFEYVGPPMERGLSLQILGDFKNGQPARDFAKSQKDN